MYNPQLTTFIAVVENGSFTKAANALYITPTAVMKQINALEERLGVVLFERTNHGMTLTEVGSKFYDDVLYIIDYSEKVKKRLCADGNGNKQQPIRVGTSIMTPTRFLLDMWSDIQSFDPHLKIELIPFENTPVNSVEILRNLGKHIDVIAGLYDEKFLKERCCKAEYLYDKKLLFAIPLTHPLSKKTKIELADLKGERVYCIRKNWNRYIDELRNDLIVNGTEISDFDMFNINAFNLAACENVPIVTVEGWEEVHPFLKIIPAEWTYKIPFGIFHSPSPTKAVKDFICVMRKAVRKNRGE